MRRELKAAVPSAAGALFCAVAVGLGAYAAHAADVAARSRLDTAALYLFLHGLGLIALRRSLSGAFGFAVGCGLLAGTLLFSGSLIGAALFGASTRLAPAGGALLIVAWLAAALLLLRSQRD